MEEVTRYFYLLHMKINFKINSAKDQLFISSRRNILFMKFVV
jgi:hypothetical protein